MKVLNYIWVSFSGCRITDRILNIYNLLNDRICSKTTIISIFNVVVTFLLKFWYCIIASFELFLLLMMEDEVTPDDWFLENHKPIPRKSFIQNEKATTITIHDSFLKAFSNMNKLWENKTFCDVTVKVGDRKFEAHRIVLASTIPFFKSMFSSNMRESYQDVVELKEIDEIALELIMKFAYTGSIEINVNNVQSLMMSAPFFQLFDIQDACASFLMDRFSVDNIIGMQALGVTFNCTRLAESADKYIRRNFVRVTNSEEFLSLSVADVINIIRKDKLVVNSEEEIFYAVMRWIKHDEAVRGDMMPRLLIHVRLPLMMPSFLVNIVSREPLIKMSLECRDLVDEAKDNYLVPGGPSVLAEYKTRVRCDQVTDHIFVVGGITTHGNPLRCMEVFGPGMNAWNLCVPMFTPRSRLGVAAWENEVYAIGGFNGTERLADVEVFNTDKNIWSRAEPMNFKRSASGAVFLNGKLYVCGGFDGVKSLNVIEQYCPDMKIWTILSSMPKSLSALAMVTLRNYLYVLGGHDGSVIYSSVLRYDPRINEWEEMRSMHVKRCRLGAAVLDGKIYVCGGYDGIRFLSSVEVYDPMLDQWNFVQPMSGIRSRLAVVACENKLWAMGGYDGTTQLASMEIYNPKTNAWTVGPTMTDHDGGVGACVAPYFQLK